ncbi:MAG: alpha/beta hydrolase [Wenzhouxiangellaceae bacterium]
MTWRFDSALLNQSNPLGDPVQRPLSVYLPAAYDEDRERRFPVLWSLAAYTSSGPAQLGWRNHGEAMPDRLDRLIDDGVMNPVIVVFPDSYTSLGGNQFVDSPAMGAYASHLIEELVPEVDARFRTIAEPAGRGVFGKSSGGFGGLHLAARHPGTFAGVASHAGDCGFDRVYLRDIPACCDELARHDGDLVAFAREFWRSRRPSGRAFHTLMMLCLAASYSPRAGRPLNLELPFDLHTAKLDNEVWRRWLEFDPVRYGEPEWAALSGLAALWIDAGSRDQYFIHYGTRELHARLDQAGVAHHYEEFDGSHSGMDWRLDSSLPWMVRRLKQD